MFDLYLKWCEHLLLADTLKKCTRRRSITHIHKTEHKKLNALHPEKRTVKPKEFIGKYLYMSECIVVLTCSLWIQFDSHTSLESTILIYIIMPKIKWIIIATPFFFFLLLILHSRWAFLTYFVHININAHTHTRTTTLKSRWEVIEARLRHFLSNDHNTILRWHYMSCLAVRVRFNEFQIKWLFRFVIVACHTCFGVF